MRLVMLPGFDIPLIVRKSDGTYMLISTTFLYNFFFKGGYGYDSTDMAAILYRLEKLDRYMIVLLCYVFIFGYDRFNSPGTLRPRLLWRPLMFLLLDVTVLTEPFYIRCFHTHLCISALNK